MDGATLLTIFFFLVCSGLALFFSLRILSSRPDAKTGFRVLAVSIFVLAVVLRSALACLNRESNDNHLQVVNIILAENRIPERKDCWECFQPKLYHLTVAGAIRAMPFKTYRWHKTVIAQAVNCVAGIVTVYLVWFFLVLMRLSPRSELIIFSLLALNPRLIGINAQATNDSFVILFSCAALYFSLRFFREGKLRHTVGLTVSAVLAALSKPNGIVAFFALLMILVISLLGGGKHSVVSRKKVVAGLLLLTLVFLSTVPWLGQYVYHQRHYRFPYKPSSQRPASPPLHLYKKTETAAPGVTSIIDSYATFRFIGLIRQPHITHYADADYPLHRTSLWTQLYGRTHFLFFVPWPPSWSDKNPPVSNIGRAIFLLALLPALVFSWGVFKRIGRWVAMLWSRKARGYLKSQDWMMDVFFLGYLAFIILYTARLRTYTSMKAIFIFPALLAIAGIWGREYDSFYARWGRKKLPRRFFDFVTIALTALYVLTVVILINKLI